MRREQTAFYVVIGLFTLLFFCSAWAETDGKKSNFDLSQISKRIEENSADERDLATLTELAGKQPGDANLNYLLGRYLENKGFEQLALDSYGNAIKCDPKFKLAHYMRCQILLRTGEVEAALSEVRLCEQLFAGDGDKLFLLGQCMQAAGKPDDAKRLFYKSTLAGHKTRGYGVVIAKSKLQQRKFDEALEAVNWDLKVNSNDPRANMFKAEILLGMKRNEEAIECFLQAVKSAPCDQSAARVVAQRLIERKLYKEALQAALFDLLCPQDNEAVMEQSKLNVLYLIDRVGEKESQIVINAVSAEIEKLLKCRRFRLALGDIFDRLNRPVLAMGQYQLAIHDCPARYTEDHILARVYFRLGRDYESVFRNHREALEHYRRAKTLAPGDPEIKANYFRLENRMKTRKNDVSAHLKDAWYSFWKTVWPPR